MRDFLLTTLGFLSCLLGHPAPGSAQEAILVPPAVTWADRTHRDQPATGTLEIKVITNARAFEERWKAWRPREPAPSVNFTDYFVVEAVQPGGDYCLLGLTVGQKGQATFSGVGVLQQLGVPKGYGYTIAIFPRKGIKKVGERDLAAEK